MPLATSGGDIVSTVKLVIYTHAERHLVKHVFVSSNSINAKNEKLAYAA